MEEKCLGRIGDKMITKNTIEEKIAELQEKKGELFNNLISSDSASAKNLDKSDHMAFAFFNGFLLLHF